MPFPRDSMIPAMTASVSSAVTIALGEKHPRRLFCIQPFQLISASGTLVIAMAGKAGIFFHRIWMTSATCCTAMVDAAASLAN
jgi:hypothetical protein